MLTTDRVAGAALVLVALLALADSRGLPLGTVRNPGPAYVPVLLAGGLLLLGALIGASGSRAPRLGTVGWSEWRQEGLQSVYMGFIEGARRSVELGLLRRSQERSPGIAP